MLYIFLVFQRLTELGVARRHAQRAFADGGYEVGQDHYKWMVGTHVLFFALFLVETMGYRRETSDWFSVWFEVFAVAQVARNWIIGTLGPYWNTRIIVVPGMRPVRTGPYRYMNHPNYAVVVAELVAILMMFDAYITAVVASVANVLVLRVRIRDENQALADARERAPV